MRIPRDFYALNMQMQSALATYELKECYKQLNHIVSHQDAINALMNTLNAGFAPEAWRDEVQHEMTNAMFRPFHEQEGKIMWLYTAGVGIQKSIGMANSNQYTVYNVLDSYEPDGNYWHTLHGFWEENNFQRLRQLDILTNTLAPFGDLRARTTQHPNLGTMKSGADKAINRGNFKRRDD